MKKILIAVFSLAAVLQAGDLFASVDFEIYSNPGVLGYASFTDVEATERDIEAHPRTFFENNRDVIPYGFALVNGIGYPNGKSIIKPFPHFEAGFAAGGAVYKYSDDVSLEDDNSKVPGGGANAAFHFGTGLADRIDLTVKLMYSKSFYSPSEDYSGSNEIREYYVKLDGIDLFSVGGKLRYNLVGEKQLVPYVFSFGGITASVALDYMYGSVRTSGHYYDRRDVDFTIDDPVSGTNVETTAGIDSRVSGRTEVNWSIISATPEIFAYMDLFYLFSFYTGPSVSLNAGAVRFISHNRGTVTNTDAISAGVIEYVPVDSQIATGRLDVDETMNAPYWIPKWVVGLELNFWAVKMQLEATSVLTSPTDSLALQAGLRVQF
jgi:hypothetical protein